MSEKEPQTLEERVAALERCCFYLTLELGTQDCALQALIAAVPEAREYLARRAAAAAEAEERRKRAPH